MLNIEWGAASDAGRVRHVNEDSLLVRAGVFVVADGMGGHAAGEVASSTAVEVLDRELPSGGGVDVGRVVDAIRTANESVLRRALASPGMRGMGTTVTAAIVAGEDGEGRTGVVIANVGDSRTYLYSDGALRQLTRDHSYVAELMAAGEITAQEALVHPHRHVVTRALGVETGVAVDAWLVTPQAGDRYLLCSDGLTNEVDDAHIAALLAAHPDPQQAANALVEAANEHGGRDNITVIVLDVTAVPDAHAGTDDHERVVQQDVGGWLSPAEAEAFPRDEPLPPPADPRALTDGLPDDITAPLTRPPLDKTSIGQPNLAPTTTGRTVAARPHHPGTTRRRRRILSLGSVLFAFGVLAVFVTAFVVIAAFGRSGYFVAFGDDDAVTIYKGRPDGVLWFQPTVEEVSEITRIDLREDFQVRIERRPTFSSAQGARSYVDNLAANPNALVPELTIPSTTAPDASPPTSSPGPTTTRAPATGTTAAGEA